MTKPVKKFSLHRPHRRIQEHGELINPHTGDITIPPSMTKQEFRKETDVNNIVKHFKPQQMLMMTEAVMSSGGFQDLPDAFDYQESLHVIQQAERSFMTLPAKVRDRFGQDPAEFLAFLTDPNNADEARRLGMLKPLEAAPPPIKVEIANPPEKSDDQKA